MHGNPSTLPPGFHVRKDRLFDAHGNDFVPRGVNHGHAWFPDRLQASLSAIASTGANSVRMVLSTGARWQRTSAGQIREILDACHAHRLVAILEVHDCTGWGEIAEARDLDEAVDYWLGEDVRSALRGSEGSVIVNLANEPFGNGVPSEVYVQENSRAIRRLRQGGFRHLLMVDAANWGQDREGILRTRAPEILEADPDRNVVFSVHMYEHFGTEEKVRAYLAAFRGRLPLVVGEFAADHGAGGDVDEEAILRWADRYGIGVLGWSWKGNASPLEGLDIASTWEGELTPWGRTLVDGEHGLRARTAPAPAFEPEAGN